MSDIEFTPFHNLRDCRYLFKSMVVTEWKLAWSGSEYSFQGDTNGFYSLVFRVNGALAEEIYIQYHD